MAKTEHLDLWEPIEQMNNCSFHHHDFEVQAKLRSRLQNHLSHNLENFVAHGFTLLALKEIVEKYDLGVGLIDQFHFLQISLKIDSMDNLSELEKSLIERFPLHHHPWAIGRLCKEHPQKLEMLVRRQKNWEEACRGQFKKWFESRDWSRLVFSMSQDTKAIIEFIPERLQRDEMIRAKVPLVQRLRWDMKNLKNKLKRWWNA